MTEFEVFGPQHTDRVAEPQQTAEEEPATRTKRPRARKDHGREGAVSLGDMKDAAFWRRRMQVREEDLMTQAVAKLQAGSVYVQHYDGTGDFLPWALAVCRAVRDMTRRHQEPETMASAIAKSLHGAAAAVWRAAEAYSPPEPWHMLADLADAFAPPSILLALAD